MKCITGFLISLFVTCHFLIAVPQDTLNIIPEDRFDGGEKMFYQLMTKHIEYPIEARSKLKVGTEVISFSIDEDGELNGIEILNSISPYIDDEIRQALKKIRKKWSPSADGHKHVFLLPVRFDITGCSYLRKIPPGINSVRK